MERAKIAIVTGGSRGLGRNMAMKLAEKNIDIIITYHTNKKAADEVVLQVGKMGRKATAFQLDTGNIKMFDRFFEDVTK